ncbi:SusC/RagA family TonB-linked outer membrane protein [Sphingobacterium sp. LRF_L2]|uniref:SusC/RagA family TonB-linked outer membrane protein n=1 Tax=Sphingobacterium sp. LRF_L2 TaxID=3369421 RepID=UPI003F6462EA
MKRNLKILYGVALAFYCQAVSAQDLRMRGTVQDREGGKPLSGVTVRVKGREAITRTDNEGKFKLLVNKGEVLLLQSVGYQSGELLVTREGHVAIELVQDQQQLEEVLVTGAFGIKRAARQMGVSTGLVSDKQLNQTAVVNPLEGLQSKVAGLQINMFDSGVNPQVRVTLRGARNIADGANEPLFVVDGVPMPAIEALNPQLANSSRTTSAFSAINPNDIEEITVLKGANAAAIYGSQGVNGVILVTTKKGKPGHGQISFTNSTLLENVGWLPQFQEEFGAGFNGVFQPYEIRSWGPKYDGSTVQVGPVLPDGTQWDLTYSPIKNQKRDFFDTGVTQQNGLTFSGGDAKSTFYMSAQHAITKGIIPKDKSNKTSLRFSGTRNFEKLDVGYNVAYVRTNDNTTTSEPWNNVRGLPLYIPITELQDWQNDPKASPDYFFSNSSINPYWGIDNQRRYNTQHNWNGNVNVSYTFNTYLKAIYRLGATNVNTALRTENAPIKYAAVLGADGKAYARPANQAGSVVDRTLGTLQLNSDLILQYDRNFGKFSMHALVGHNYQDQTANSVQVGSSAVLIPGTYNQDNRTGNLSGGTYKTHARRYSFFGEVTLGYNNYLFATFNGRNESVSLLSPDNRTFFYPGGNVSFIFSDAIEALKDNTILSYGKLYASASKTANVSIAPYQLLNTYVVSTGFPYGNLSGFEMSGTNANFDLKPEFVYSWEVGTQLQFFRNRLRTEVTYANADARDQALEVGTSYVTGFGSSILNAARMKSKSWEFTLSGDVLANKDWTVTLGANYTHNDNKAVELPGEGALELFKNNYFVVGERFPTFMLSDYARDPQGRIIVDSNGNVKQAAQDRKVGTSQPVHMFGANFAVRYKNIELSGQIDARWGSVFHTAAAESTLNNGLLPRTAEYGREPFVIPNSVVEVSPGVYQENTDIYSAGDQAWWLGAQRSFLAPNSFNARYIKLREVSIRYNLPVSSLQRVNFIKSASIALIGRNLINLRDQSNIFGESEFIYLSNIGFSGWRTLPASRTYGLNLNLTF